MQYETGVCSCKMMNVRLCDFVRLSICQSTFPGFITRHLQSPDHYNRTKDE